MESTVRDLCIELNELGGNPITITAMSEAYFKKIQLKPEVRNKYRRVIKRLIAQVGDIPLEHLNADRLREFRDAQPDDGKASSLQSLFTPIRGMFKHAIGEGKISENPMPSVVLKREKRSTQMIKYRPFSPLRYVASLLPWMNSGDHRCVAFQMSAVWRYIWYVGSRHSRRCDPERFCTYYLKM